MIRHEAVEALLRLASCLQANPEIASPFSATISLKYAGALQAGGSPAGLFINRRVCDPGQLGPEDFVALDLDAVRDMAAVTPAGALEFWLARALLAGESRLPPSEVLLHARLDAPLVAFTQPRCALAIAATSAPDRLIADMSDGRVAYLPAVTLDQRTACALVALYRARPDVEGVLVGRYGLLTWGADVDECLRRTTELVQLLTCRAQLPPTARRAVGGTDGELDAPTLARLLLALRSRLPGRKVLHRDGMRLVAGGLAERITGPVRMLRSARDEAERPEQGADDEGYRVVMDDALGLVGTGVTADEARCSARWFREVLAIADRAEALDCFTRGPVGVVPGAPAVAPVSPNPELAGQVAFVTGAASGIGRAIACRFAAEGAHVVVADLNEQGAREVACEIADQASERALAVQCDVRDEQSVVTAVRQAVLAYGGLDIVVANAGVAISEAVEDLELVDWQRVMDVNLTGYVLTAREAFRVFRAQRLGGRVLFIASKAGLAVGAGSAAYAASKAGELHLARVLAEEGGPLGIRVNSVCPDAVFRGSAIWQQGWREERSRVYGIKPEEIEEHYRQRSALKLSIYPEDVAEAALFLVSDRAAKITGAVLTVDGGVAGAYVR